MYQYVECMLLPPSKQIRYILFIQSLIQRPGFPKMLEWSKFACSSGRQDEEDEINLRRDAASKLLNGVSIDIVHFTIILQDFMECEVQVMIISEVLFYTIRHSSTLCSSLP